MLSQEESTSMVDRQEQSDGLQETKPRVMYVGFPGREEASLAKMPMNWVVYPATPEGIAQARDDGYQAISVFAFSHPIEVGKPKPIVYGDIVIDFDAKREIVEADNSVRKVGDIERALKAVRMMTEILHSRYSVDPNTLRFYASGGKGFHVIIPRELIGSEDGDTILPKIYQRMVDRIASFENMSKAMLMDGALLHSIRDRAKFSITEVGECIDRNTFKGGRGQLLRLPHIKRPNGNYKIPVTYDEILTKDAHYFEELVRTDRTLPCETEMMPLTRVDDLEQLFLEVKEFLTNSMNHGHADKIFAQLESNCEFVKYCRDHAIEIDERYWFTLAAILGKGGEAGCELFHQYSALDTERYNFVECQKKYEHGLKYSQITCKYIKDDLCFQCGKECKVKSPVDLYRKAMAESIEATNFTIADGYLVYYGDMEDKSHYERVSSSIIAKASARDTKNTGWSKIFEIVDLDGITHSCRVPYTSLNGNGEDALNIVCNAGLRVQPGLKSKKHLIAYMQAVQPMTRARIVDKNGWVSEEYRKYIPFDLGEQRDQTEYLCCMIEQEKPLYTQQGTLQEWQENIGKLCLDNPLQQVAIVAALAGPCIKMLNHQGFGIHFYGDSSCGKTTTLDIAASVTGAEAKSWRTTDNGLEGIAVLHNDSTLILDEINQCDPDTVANVVYMLANGQGKSRASKKGASRAAMTWDLIFLSSGEQSIRERTSQGIRNKAMAGHEVRAISIHANCGTNYGAFKTLPEGVSSSKDFANMLKKNAQSYRGTAFQEFVAILKQYDGKLSSFHGQVRESFLEKYKEAKLSSQAERVGEHFAFLAIVGEAAICERILPWYRGDAIKACSYCFDSWLKDNKGGDIDFEIIEAVEKLLKDVAVGFYGKVGDEYHIQKKDINGHVCYFIPKGYITQQYCRVYQYTKFVDELDKRRLLVHTSDGKKEHQYSRFINGTRPRGIYLDSTNLFSEDSERKIQLDEPTEMRYMENYGVEF